MTWGDFLAIPNGETVNNYGAQECVALANLYATSVLGCDLSTVNIGCAEQWWTTDAILDAWGFDRINSNPQVGDIFIGSYGLYDAQFGHIGVVVRAWDGSTFGTMEQNVGGEWVSRHDRTMQNIDGFLRTHNQAAIGGGQPAPALAGNQRQAGSLGVFRRSGPTQNSDHLQPDLEAGEVGNFVGFVHGENRDGNDVWFQGVSGNFFWSGAFTDSGTHDLPDLTAGAVSEPAPIEPAPVEPTPEPVSPEPTPEPIIVEPTPVEPTPVAPEPTPIIPVTPKPEKPMPTPEEIATQEGLIAQVQPVDLGAIIGNGTVRKVVWAVYGLLGLFILAVGGGLQAIHVLAPEWFMFMVGSYAALGPAFSGLAMANIKSSK
jgi:hypothetical protein